MSVRRLAEFCRNACDKHLSEQTINAVELAIVEAANNIIEYANKLIVGNPVELKIIHEGTRLRFSFIYHGKDFDLSQVKDPNFEWTSVYDVPERGWGLFLIRHIMDNLDFNHEDGLNFFSMTHQLEVPVLESDIFPLVYDGTKAEFANRELDIATNLQQQLLPKTLPDLPGVLFYANSKSALQVGGDYLAIHVIDPNTICFFICDAMGKGMSAALFALMSHTALNGILTSRQDSSPGEILTLINSVMNADFDRFGMFMTALVGKIDLKKNLLTFANAGHGPLIVYSEEEGLDLLDTDDYMLGVDQDTIYTESSIEFTPGMKLVAYTDGITDIIDKKGEMIGLDPLVHACSSELRRNNVVDACSKIFSEAIIASGKHLQDDISLLGIER